MGSSTRIGGLAGLLVIPFVGRYYDLRFRKDPAQALRLIALLTLPSALLTPVQYFMPNAVLYTIASIPQVVLLSSAFTMIGPLLQTIVPYRLRGLGAAMGSIYVFFFGATGGALIALPLTNAYGPQHHDPADAHPGHRRSAGVLIIRSRRSSTATCAMAVEEIREEDDRPPSSGRRPRTHAGVQVADVDFSYGPCRCCSTSTFEVAARRGAGAARHRTAPGKSTHPAGDRRARHAAVGWCGSTAGRSRSCVARAAGAAWGSCRWPAARRVFPSMTVAREPDVRCLTSVEDPASARRDRPGATNSFPVLRERLDRAGAGSLSGGEQQMLAIGKALLPRSRGAAHRRALARAGAGRRAGAARGRSSACKERGHDDGHRRAVAQRRARHRRPGHLHGEGRRCGSTARPRTCSSVTTSCGPSSSGKAADARRSTADIASRSSSTASSNGLAYGLLAIGLVLVYRSTRCHQLRPSRAWACFGAGARRTAGPQLRRPYCAGACSLGLLVGAALGGDRRARSSSDGCSTRPG